MKDLFEFQYTGYRERVEGALLHYLPSKQAAPCEVHEAMHYCVNAGGKRLRPVLLLACAELFPQQVDPLAAAAAIEYLHTYTLVHDDLPCMDDSPLRRGRPSAHIQFDEATAVLAGDALLTEAFAVLARAYADAPAIGMRLIGLLAEAADSRHLIGGQVLDTLSENQPISADQLDFIHQHKTADLITAACLMGISLTEAPKEAVIRITNMGRAMGLAFQIVDDVLDATSDAATMGKSVGHDARHAKNTYVTLHGVERSREVAGSLTTVARDACRGIVGADTTFLQQLIAKLEFRLQ